MALRLVAVSRLSIKEHSIKEHSKRVEALFGRP
jgi:hypothetical protein